MGAVGRRIGLIAALLVGIAGVLLALVPSELWSSCPTFARKGMYWMRDMIDTTPLGGLPIYTLADLARHDGEDESVAILLAMNGDVFDVTEKGKQYYGKGAGYHMFAGKDSTRALSLGSLSDEDVYKTDVSDFDDKQKQLLLEQHAFYVGKYPRVGRVAGYKTLRPQDVAKPKA